MTRFTLAEANKVGLDGVKKAVADGNLQMDDIMRVVLDETEVVLKGNELYTVAEEARNVYFGAESGKVAKFLRFIALWKLAIDDLAERQNKCGIALVNTLHFNRGRPELVYEYSSSGIHYSSLWKVIPIVERQERVWATKQIYAPLFLEQAQRIDALCGWMEVEDEATVKLPRGEIGDKQDYYVKTKYTLSSNGLLDFLLFLDNKEKNDLDAKRKINKMLKRTVFTDVAEQTDGGIHNEE